MLSTVGKPECPSPIMCVVSITVSWKLLELRTRCCIISPCMLPHSESSDCCVLSILLTAQVLPHDSNARRLFVTSGGLKRVRKSCVDTTHTSGAFFSFYTLRPPRPKHSCHGNYSLSLEVDSATQQVDSTHTCCEWKDFTGPFRGSDASYPLLSFYIHTYLDIPYIRMLTFLHLVPPCACTYVCMHVLYLP